MDASVRSAAVFGAGLLLGLVVGLAAVGGRTRAGDTVAPSPGVGAHDAVLQDLAPDRSVLPAVDGGGAGPASRSATARPSSERADLPEGDPTARVVLDALREVARWSPGASSRGGAGAGRITGKVLRPDDTPVAGAVVTLVSEDDLWGRGGASAASAQSGGGPGEDDPDTIETQLRKDLRASAVRHARLLRSERRETTGPGGAFAFEGLAAGEYSLRATVPGGRHDTEKLGRSGVSPGDPDVVLTAVPAARLVVDVRLPDGAPAHGASVQANGPSSRTWEWSAGAGSAWLEPGAYVVAAYLYDEETTMSSPQRTVTLGDEGAAITLELSAPPSIRGRLLDEGGRPLDASDANSVIIWYARVPPGDDAAATFARNDRRRATGTRGEGRYRIDDAAPGLWAIAATRGHVTPGACATVEVGAGPVEFDLVVPPLDESAVVRVRVLGPDGQPRRGAQAEARLRFAGGDSHGSVSSLERPGGLYLLPLDQGGAERLREGARAPGDRFTVSVSAPGLGAAQRDVAEPLGGEIVVQLGPPAVLTLTVRGDLGGGRAQAARVALRRAGARRGEGAMGDLLSGDDDGDEIASIQLDALGRACLGPVEAGPYELSIVVSSMNTGERTALARGISLEPGGNDLALDAPPLGVIRIEGAEGGDMMLYRAARGAAPDTVYVPTPQPGQAREVDLLAPGPYVLALYGGDVTGAMAIRATGAAATIHFVPDAGERFELVYVQEPIREGERELIRRGDVLVAIDGRPVRDVLQVDAIIQELREARHRAEAAAPEREDGAPEPPPPPMPVVTISRGGSRLDVPATDEVLGSLPFANRCWLPYPR